MLTPNPTNDRLNFILKTYGQKKPAVVMEMVGVVAHTVGVDDWRQRVREGARTASDGGQFLKDYEAWAMSTIEGRLRITTPALAEATVAMVNELPEFRKRHRADPLFPWAATQLAKAAPTSAQDDGDDASADAYRYRVIELQRRGTALAQWYEATRPNLGQYDFTTAMLSVGEWSEENEGAGLPQGEIVAQLSDGWTAQKLTTQECLSAEGEAMQHCVASYSPAVAKGQTVIYSLRDKHGRPHVTIEVKNGRVQQTQGKQNEKPAEKYQKYVDEFYEWLREHDVDTEKYPKRLIPYVEALEEHATDLDDENIEWVARDWEEHIGSADRTAEWLKSGFNANEARIAGALADEDVTPEEWATFPDAIRYKITENGEPHDDTDDLIEIARMAIVLGGLAPRRDPEPAEDPRQTSFSFGEDEETVARRLHATIERRVPGHDPTGLRPVTAKWDKSPKQRWPSLSFEYWSDWSGDRGGDDVEWLYPAEEWLAESFSYKDHDDAYVGPWFLHRFTPQSATAWWEAGIENGDLAAALAQRRVKPEMLEQVDVSSSITEFASLDRRATKAADYDTDSPQYKADIKRYTEEIADQIARQIDDAGLRRNPKRTSKRASRRRTSRRR